LTNNNCAHYSLAQTWLARAGFYDFGPQSISTTVLYSKQLAPGRAIIPVFPGQDPWPRPLAQTPGPDLAWQDAVMESEAFIISENSCISTSRRTRAGWLPGPEFSGCLFQNITATTAYSRQVAPGQANIPIVPARQRSRSGEAGGSEVN